MTKNSVVNNLKRNNDHLDYNGAQHETIAVFRNVAKYLRLHISQVVKQTYKTRYV